MLKGLVEQDRIRLNHSDASILLSLNSLERDSRFIPIRCEPLTLSALRRRGKARKEGETLRSHPRVQKPDGLHSRMEAVARLIPKCDERHSLHFGGRGFHEAKSSHEIEDWRPSGRAARAAPQHNPRVIDNEPWYKVLPARLEPSREDQRMAMSR